MEIRCTGILFSVFSIISMVSIISAAIRSGILRSDRLWVNSVVEMRSKTFTIINTVLQPTPYFAFLFPSHMIKTAPVIISATAIVHTTGSISFSAENCSSVTCVTA